LDRLERLKKEERKPYDTSPITDRRHSFDIAPNEHLPDFIADGQELLPEWIVRGAITLPSGKTSPDH
jgi:hypothetical protein